MSFVPAQAPPSRGPRGRGFVHRPEKYHRLGAPHPTTAAAPFAPASSLLRYKTFVLNQGQTNSCPGAGTSALVFVALAAAGEILPFIPSPRGIYGDTRAIEEPGTGLLEDGGADPVDLRDALSSEGVRAMTPAVTPDGRVYDLWGPEDVKGIAGAPPPNVGDRPTAAEDEASQADLVLGVELVDPAAADFGPHVCASIDVDHAPVGIGIHATPAFEGWGDSFAPGKAPLADVSGVTKTDGHWVGIYQYQTLSDGSRIYWIGNSWGTSWGDSGGGIWVTEAWLAEMTMVALKFKCALKAAA